MSTPEEQVSAALPEGYYADTVVEIRNRAPWGSSAFLPASSPGRAGAFDTTLSTVTVHGHQFRV